MQKEVLIRNGAQSAPENLLGHRPQAASIIRDRSKIRATFAPEISLRPQHPGIALRADARLGSIQLSYVRARWRCPGERAGHPH